MTAAPLIAAGSPDAHQSVAIAGAATTVVCARPCTLRAIRNTKKVANGVITVYDNASAASGTVIATITNPGTLLDSGEDYRFDRFCVNGIVIVTSAADALTVTFD